MTFGARLQVLILCLCLASTVAIAGPDEKKKSDGSGSNGEQRRGDRQDSNSMSDEDIRELVSTIMMVRISRDLELNEEQTVVLVRNLQQMREEISKLYRERERAFKEMKDLARDGATSDEVLNQKLEELRAFEDKREAVKHQIFDKAAEGMTVRQKAKLYVTLQEFDWQMRRLVIRAKDMSDEELKKLREKYGRDFDGEEKESKDSAPKKDQSTDKATTQQ